MPPTLPLYFNVDQYTSPIYKSPPFIRKNPTSDLLQVLYYCILADFPVICLRKPTWNLPVSWSLTPEKPRSPPQIVTPPASLPDEIFLTLTDPDPTSVVDFLNSYRLGATSWYSGRPPSSFRPTVLASAPDTLISPLPICTPPILPPWYWRMPSLGLRSRRPFAATASACSCHTSFSYGYL